MVMQWLMYTYKQTKLFPKSDNMGYAYDLVSLHTCTSKVVHSLKIL